MSKEKEEWLALPACKRVDQALGNNGKMGVLLEHLRNAKLNNMSGSAFRSHSQCLFRDGILFIDHWKTWGDYEISIANDPSKTPSKGCQDSCAYEDPYPKIEAGWTTVWRSGTWKKTGPWCEKIADCLARLLEEADVILAQMEAATKAAQDAARRERQEQEQNLIAAWSNN